MTITPQQFIANFPEFSLDQAGQGFAPKYPQSQIQFYLNWAYLSLNVCRWLTMLDLGAQLFAAHYVVLEAQAADQVATGGEPGASTGLIASTSVGPVSVSYDTSSAIDPTDTELNLTVYGSRFARLRKDFGAGGLVTNGPQFPGGLGWTAQGYW